jgi:hypothetical protein
MAEKRTRRQKRKSNKRTREYIGERKHVRGHKKIKQAAKKGYAFSQKAKR